MKKICFYIILAVLLSGILATGFYSGYKLGTEVPPSFIILKHGSFVSVGGVFFSYGLNQWADTSKSKDPYNVQIEAANSAYTFNSTVKQGDILNFPRWGQYKIDYLDTNFISIEKIH
jgi:hypothetical protein